MADGRQTCALSAFGRPLGGGPVVRKYSVSPRSGTECLTSSLLTRRRLFPPSEQASPARPMRTSRILGASPPEGGWSGQPYGETVSVSLPALRRLGFPPPESRCVGLCSCPRRSCSQVPSLGRRDRIQSPERSSQRARSTRLTRRSGVSRRRSAVRGARRIEAHEPAEHCTGPWALYLMGKTTALRYRSRVPHTAAEITANALPG